MIMAITRVTLPSGRIVLDTGKVRIGLRAPDKPAEQGEHARIIQRVMCTPLPRQWQEHPHAFYVSPSPWRRILELLKGIA